MPDLSIYAVYQIQGLSSKKNRLCVGRSKIIRYSTLKVQKLKSLCCIGRAVGFANNSPDHGGIAAWIFGVVSASAISGVAAA
jgi:hypothetical protein